MLPFALIKDVAQDYHAQIMEEKLFGRSATPKIAKSMAQEEVTVLTGVRRSGKTSVMYSLMKKFGGVYINFEDERLAGFSIEDFEKIEQLEQGKGRKIFYLDEVQHAKGWERFAHRVQKTAKVVVTGSNSSLLGGEYSTALTGRTKTFTIAPLSFGEFLEVLKLAPSRQSLERYLGTGGFPRVALSGDKELLKEYVEAIISRDILMRKNPRYPQALRMIALYLLSNIGKPFSYNKLAQYAGLEHEMTAKEYVGYLEEAFLLGHVNRYDPSLKRQESYEKKIYATDHSLAFVGMRGSPDYGRFLENAVYAHLIRHGSLFFSRNGGETDFLLTDSLRPRRAVNVFYEPQGDEMMEREISPLREWKKKGVRATLVGAYSPRTLESEVDFELAHEFLREL